MDKMRQLKVPQQMTIALLLRTRQQLMTIRTHQSKSIIKQSQKMLSTLHQVKLTRQVRCLLRLQKMKVKRLRISQVLTTQHKPQMKRMLGLIPRLWSRLRQSLMKKLNLKIPLLLTTQLRTKSSRQMSLMLKTIKRLIKPKLIMASRLQTTINRILIRQSLLMRLKLKSSPPRSQMSQILTTQAMRLSQLILRQVRITLKTMCQ